MSDYHNPDAQPLLGVIADGDLVALAEHQCDPLTALRAEVERLRDQAAQTHKKASRAVSMYWHRQNYDSWAASQTLSNQYHAATNHALASAYSIVLDLIDKQREGQ